MPLDPKLTKYTTTSPNIVSYNFTDIAEGTGTVLYYGFATKTKTETDYHISQNPFSSSYGKEFEVGLDTTTAESISEDEDGSGPAYKAYTEFDFDSSVFKFPQTIEGTAYAILSYMTDQVGASGNANGYYGVDIIHWDGTTETVLGGALGIVDTAAAGPQTTTIPIVCTPKLFNKGDVLRCKLTAYMRHNSGAADTGMVFAHDPLNRDTTQITAADNQTKLEFYIPFNIDP